MFMVPAFQPAAVVPGLRVRRLDQLSVWAIVTAYLAMQDAGFDPKAVHPARVAIVAGTGFGCLASTEAYLEGVACYGYGASDPIIFPDTLNNAPASHVARTFGFRGPNITLSCRGISGEVALLQGRSLLRAGETDVAIVISGDLLTRPLYDWYEAGSLLSRACYDGSEVPTPFGQRAGGFFPGEGMAAVVLERSGWREDTEARSYARIHGGCSGAEPGVPVMSWGKSAARTVELCRRLFGVGELADCRLVISSANGAPGLDRLEAEVIHTLFGDSEPAVAAPKAVTGEFEGSGILNLVLALSRKGIVRGPPPPDVPGSPERGAALLLGTSTGGGRAAVRLELAPGVNRSA